MHCNARTMIKIAAVLGGILAVAYLALPDARELVAASAPVLLALICPISMVIMMLTMRKSGGAESSAPAKPPQGSVAEPAILETQPAKAKEAAAP